MRLVFNIFLSAVRALIFFPISALSYFFPKNPDIWIFGSWFGEKYSDNTRYMYEYVLDKGGVTAVWITKNKSLIPEIEKKGGKVYYAYSFWGIWYCLRAGKAFYVCGPSDISEYVVFRTMKVMFWHGIPLKRILYDDNLRYPKGFWGDVNRIRDFCLRSVLPDKKQNWDYVISSSPLVTERLCSAFRIKPAKVLEFGYPRQDILAEAASSCRQMHKVILYAPTHRKEGKGGGSAVDFFEGFDFEYYDDYFYKNNIRFFINLHFYHDASPLVERLKGMRAIALFSGGDIYRALGSVDVLITDYSSIYIDYLFLGRKIVFYSFDHEDYVASDRGLYEDYFSEAPGAICATWPEVIDMAVRDFTEEESLRLSRSRDKYFSCASEMARERLFRFLTEASANH